MTRSYHWGVNTTRVRFFFRDASSRPPRVPHAKRWSCVWYHIYILLAIVLPYYFCQFTAVSKGKSVLFTTLVVGTSTHVLNIFRVITWKTIPGIPGSD